jgi:hypothetical protein
MPAPADNPDRGARTQIGYESTSTRRPRRLPVDDGRVRARSAGSDDDLGPGVVRQIRMFPVVSISGGLRV